jgi:phage FluMu protein gp41
VREASVRALGDVGGPITVRLIRRLGGTDASPMVREAAEEVLHDLEG